MEADHAQRLQDRIDVCDRAIARLVALGDPALQDLISDISAVREDLHAELGGPAELGTG